MKDTWGGGLVVELKGRMGRGAGGGGGWDGDINGTKKRLRRTKNTYIRRHGHIVFITIT